MNKDVTLGIVGWRGMVGSVLLERMRCEGDFDKFCVTLFSTSQAGQAVAVAGLGDNLVLQDAYNLDELKRNKILISAQGSDYTARVYSQLMASGWDGFWIDAASSLRLENNACIVLDPVNLENIEHRLDNGCRTLVGGNCTVSLLLMAIGILFKEGYVEWASTSTYQAASGAGARQMIELVKQSKFATQGGRDDDALELEQAIKDQLQSPALPTEELGAPLAFSLLPFIDSAAENGLSREEWKSGVEINKIINSAVPIPVDAVCVRVPVLRSHSQSFLLKLNREISLEDLQDKLKKQHSWIDVVANTKSETVAKLTPASISGSLRIAVGRLRYSTLGANFLSGFTVGDQLLWGAAEPLRRAALIVRKRC